MSRPERVVIVGAGVAGLAAAIGLTRAGIDVEVHEKYDHLARRASALTLWSFAVERLRELGLDPDRFGAPIEATEVRESDGTMIELIPVGEVSRKLGAPSYEVDRRELRAACLELLGEGVVRAGTPCVGIAQRQGSATALLDGGGSASGDLVIGADGAHSVTRGAVAADAAIRYTGHSAWAGVIEGFEHPLLQAGHHVEVWARGSIGGVADLGSGRARWYVSHNAPAGVEWGSVDKSQIAEQVEGWYPLIPAAVDAADPETVVTMEAWELEPLAGWIDGRLVLLGDAAHLTAPSVSGGACTAIDDAASLVRHLTGDRPLEQALRDFQAERKRHDERIVRDSRWVGELQHMHSPIGCWVRDHAFEHVPAGQVRRIAERMAAGV